MKTPLGRSAPFKYPSLGWVSCTCLLALMVTRPCVAQGIPPTQTLDTKACSDEQRLRLDNGTVHEPSDPASQTSSERLVDPSNQTLSEKLEHTEGVICPPPGIDPEIATPPPGGGITPVIPPPGSPGGDPTVRPK